MKNSSYVGKHEPSDSAIIYNAYQRAINEQPKEPIKKGALIPDAQPKRKKKLPNESVFKGQTDLLIAEIDEILSDKYPRSDYDSVIDALFNPEEFLNPAKEVPKTDVEDLFADFDEIYAGLDELLSDKTKNSTKTIDKIETPITTSKKEKENQQINRRKKVVGERQKVKEENDFLLQAKACFSLLNGLKKKKKNKVINTQTYTKHNTSDLKKAAVIFLATSLAIGGTWAVALAGNNALQENDEKMIASRSIDEEVLIEQQKLQNDTTTALEAYDKEQEFLKKTEVIRIYMEKAKKAEEKLNALEIERREPTIEEIIDYIEKEFELTWEQYVTLVATVRQEAGNSYAESYNVISNIFLRTIDSNYAKGKTPAKCFYSQITREGQYAAYLDGDYIKHIANIENTETWPAVIDFFCSLDPETRKLQPSHNYLSFGAPGTTSVGHEGQLCPGGNEYFNYQDASRKLDYEITQSLDEYMEEKFMQVYNEKKQLLETERDEALTLAKEYADTIFLETYQEGSEEIFEKGKFLSRQNERLIP